MSNEKCPHCGEPMMWTAHCRPCDFHSDYLPHGPRVPVEVPSAEALRTAEAILGTWMVEHEEEHSRLGNHAREVRDYLRAMKGGA